MKLRTDKTLIIEVRKRTKIRNRFNILAHLTQDTRHRRYPGKGIMEGGCTHNSEDWNNKGIK